MATDDDGLLAELGSALRGARQVPASFVLAGKAAFGWRDVDAELAALSHDSAGDAITGVRADTAASRSLTFVVGERTIELEITRDAVVGQMVPAHPGEVELVGPNGRSDAVTMDDVGWFAIRPVPSGPVRLHLRMANGDSIRTEWIVQ